MKRVADDVNARKDTGTRVSWRHGADPWLPKVILAVTVVVVALALAGLFVGHERLQQQGFEQGQVRLDS
jgi:hypothetical protein